MRKFILLALAIPVLLGVGYWFVASLRMVAWVGHKSLPVILSAHDAQTGDPIPDSIVEVFDGPRTPLEGVSLGAFDIDAAAKEGQRFITDERGHCEFEHRFGASGTDGVWSTSGAIVVSGVWLRVTASDGRRVLVPIDQQSAKYRALDDRSPICVTVVFDQPHLP